MTYTHAYANVMMIRCDAAWHGVVVRCNVQPRQSRVLTHMLVPQGLNDLGVRVLLHLLGNISLVELQVDDAL